jgi:hypothetical protein
LLEFLNLVRFQESDSRSNSKPNSNLRTLISNGPLLRLPGEG